VVVALTLEGTGCPEPSRKTFSTACLKVVVVTSDIVLTFTLPFLAALRVRDLETGEAILSGTPLTAVGAVVVCIAAARSCVIGSPIALPSAAAYSSEAGYHSVAGLSELVKHTTPTAVAPRLTQASCIGAVRCEHPRARSVASWMTPVGVTYAVCARGGAMYTNLCTVGSEEAREAGVASGSYPVPRALACFILQTGSMICARILYSTRADGVTIGASVALAAGTCTIATGTVIAGTVATANSRYRIRRAHDLTREASVSTEAGAGRFLLIAHSSEQAGLLLTWASALAICTTETSEAHASSCSLLTIQAKSAVAAHGSVHEPWTVLRTRRSKDSSAVTVPVVTVGISITFGVAVASRAPTVPLEASPMSSADRVIRSTRRAPYIAVAAFVERIAVVAACSDEVSPCRAIGAGARGIGLVAHTVAGAREVEASRAFRVAELPSPPSITYATSIPSDLVVAHAFYTLTLQALRAVEAATAIGASCSGESRITGATATPGVGKLIGENLALTTIIANSPRHVVQRT
jgi:hypothetical protein